jgi:glyoxylate utilization-related uncharacterized protein
LAPSKTSLPSHFFIHKGEEVGYVLAGELQIKMEKSVHTAQVGDMIYLTAAMPSQWRNDGPDVARLLWIKVK